MSQRTLSEQIADYREKYPNGHQVDAQVAKVLDDEKKENPVVGHKAKAKKEK